MTKLSAYGRGDSFEASSSGIARSASYINVFPHQQERFHAEEQGTPKGDQETIEEEIADQEQGSEKAFLSLIELTSGFAFPLQTSLSRTRELYTEGQKKKKFRTPLLDLMTSLLLVC